MPTSSITKDFEVKDLEAYQKLLQEIEDVGEGCCFCSDDFPLELEAYVTKILSSNEQTTLVVPVRYCPYCGRKIR